MSKIVAAKWVEDASHTIYGRLMARDGSGDSIVGEGKYLKQADLASITYKVFDLDDQVIPVATGTVTISSSVFDTPITSATDPSWRNARGYNFRHDLPHTVFATGGKRYRVEYLFETNAGGRGFALFEGPVEEVFSS